MDEEKLNNKDGEWFLQRSEPKLKKFLAERVPLWIGSDHLTWVSVFWSVVLPLIFFVGLSRPGYLWLVPFVIVGHYIFDLIDGEVGRMRKSGLSRWGFYTDHFLDFVFLTSIVLGYGVALGFNVWLFLVYVALSGFMVHTFIFVGADSKLRIAFLGVGPTEGSIIVIFFHLWFMYVGKGPVLAVLPYVSIILLFILSTAFWRSQKELWEADMKRKNGN